MSKDYKQIAQDVVSGAKALRAAAPDTMTAFGALGKASYRDGAVSAKTKELIALAIGIAGRCDGCIAFHVRAALRQGATREEIMETVGTAIYMGGGPSMVYGAQALEAFDQSSAAA